MSLKTSRWFFAVGPAVIMTLLAIYPVARLPMLRGNDWNGTFAYLQGDELIYAAYVNSLRTGRPRSNNPYTGEPSLDGAPLGESAYSIQFLPAYAVALPARWFGLSTSAAFAVLLILIALGSSLVLFSLIFFVTGDRYLAAAGVIFVLCLGSVPTLWGLLQMLRGLPPDFTHLRFLRRFPGASFPFFFAFCALVWRMLTTPRRASSYIAALLAGVVFAILVFSYFYSWTAALAWVTVIGLLWVLKKPKGWQSAVKPYCCMVAVMLTALVPYAWLLTRQAPNQIAVTMLAHTHAPDLLRVPQLAGLGLIALLLVLNWRGSFDFRGRSSLIATSFAALPLLLFNQQIVTGLSLQPTHYEVFIANYCVLLATVLIAGILSSNLKDAQKRVFHLGVTFVAVLALAWGVFEVTRSTTKFAPAFVTRDEATPAARKLAEIDTNESSRTDQVILATDPVIADYLPTIAPQALLWAPHMYGFAGINAEEDKQRLRALLYYTGTQIDGGDAERFAKLDTEKKLYFSALLGRNRIDRSQSNTWKRVAPEEYESAQRAYLEFISTFNRETATHPRLALVLTSSDRTVDLSNLDRWYERDRGERIGKFILYRVKLRP
jgi:hypothetical protein